MIADKSVYVEANLVVVQFVLAEEKEPLIHAAFGPQISADQRNNVSVNQRFLLLVKVA
jgi:glutaredoxin 2